MCPLNVKSILRKHTKTPSPNRVFCKVSRILQRRSSSECTFVRVWRRSISSVSRNHTKHMVWRSWFRVCVLKRLFMNPFQEALNGFQKGLKRMFTRILKGRSLEGHRKRPLKGASYKSLQKCRKRRWKGLSKNM